MKVTLKVGEPVAVWSRVVLEHMEDSRTIWLNVPPGSSWHFQMTSGSMVQKALPKPQRVAHALGHVPHTVSTLRPYQLVFDWALPQESLEGPQPPLLGGRQRNPERN